MVLSSDQGTVVSVDGAQNVEHLVRPADSPDLSRRRRQPFPYWLYGAQQDSGGVGVSTFSREGVLSFRDWEPTCLAGESATVVPDRKTATSSMAAAPALRPGPEHRRTTGRRTAASIPNDPNRKTWTLPTGFLSADEALYFSNQFVMRSRDRGKTWEKISPDLARLIPPSRHLDPVTAKDIDQPMTDRFGVVYTIVLRRFRHDIWVGTDDGLIHVTRDDGKNWKNVTPPAMTAVEQSFADRSRPLRRHDGLCFGRSAPPCGR